MTDNNPSHFTPFIDWFRTASPYINAHRNKTFVLTLSGEAVEHDNITDIIHDIALLNSLGIKIVIVHGIRSQLDKKLAAQNIESQFVDHMRVSNRDVLHAAIESASLVRSKLETQLSMGLPNSPMHGAKIRVASANVITAKPAGIINGVDLQQTGHVRKIDTQAITTLLELGNIVLLSPIGYSPAGEAFNIAFEEIARAIASSIKADKLIAFCNQDGVIDANGELLRELDPALANQLNHSMQNSELKRSCAACIDAVKSGVPRAHLMNFAINGALLQELFTVDGTGTLITNDSFELKRQAQLDDIPAIQEILKPLESKGVLVQRSRDLLEEEISNFTVIERDGLIIAVAALYTFAKESMAEIACIATHPDYQNGNRGSTLLATLEKQAKAENIKTIFVLTTQTAHWFLEKGFAEGSNEALPEKKQALYNFQRNSKVLYKSIN